MDRSRRPDAPEFVPWDIEVARLNFGPNCGPSAFAAATGREVCRIMRYFAHFEQSQCWTNLTHMRRAFEEGGYSTEVLRLQMPSVGVALIQWTGPWTQKHFFSRWSLVHILPLLGCDGKMFTLSQPCRLPGYVNSKSGNMRTLLYLDAVEQTHSHDDQQSKDINMTLRILRLLDALPLPPIYYDARKDYHMPNDQGGWVIVNERNLTSELLLRGYNPAPYEGDLIPEIDEAINRIQKAHYADFVGRLAGWKKGFHATKNARLLVTASPKLMEPREGE